MNHRCGVLALFLALTTSCRAAGPGEPCSSTPDCRSGLLCDPVSRTCRTADTDGGPVGSDAGTDGGGDAGTDAGSDAGTDAGSDAGADASDAGVSSRDLRATVLNVTSPTTLGIVNGILASDLASGSLNFLLRVSDVTVATPTLEVGDGDPGAGLGEYLFPVTTTTFAATLDLVTRNLVTTSAGDVSLDIDIDTDGDLIADLVIPLDLVGAVFDVFFDLSYASIVETAGSDTSLLTGGLTVEGACAINIDLGGGTFLNVLDILDGSGMGTTAPNLTPGMCAAGTGASNIQPDTDTDGDGVADAYLVTMLIAADPVVITN